MMLSKVFLPAITGHVPTDMVRAISAFSEFCSLVRRSVISEDSLLSIDEAVISFHHYREIFCNVGVRPTGFSLPRQHSLVHYHHLIQMFGAPNGLCSSITESKHIKAVKKPWRRSNRHNALGQMLITNQRLSKLAAAHVDFTARGMMEGHGLQLDVEQDDDADADADAEDGEKCLGEVKLAKTYGECEPCYFINHLTTSTARGYPRDINQLSHHTGHLNLQELIQRFLYDQLHLDAEISGQDIDLQECPQIDGYFIRVFHSAVATFYAPSDISGIHGMHRERIYSTPSWRQGPCHYDCVFIEKDPTLDGFQGMHVACVYLFFSFTHNNITYPCALVHWFSPISNEPCEDTGMWIVEPDILPDRSYLKAVIHLDCILCGAHLIGNYGRCFLPKDFSYHDSLDAFDSYYVNKYADHQSHEIAF